MTPGRPLRVLVAPDSFKGSLSSVEVAAAIAEGWRQARPDDSIEQIPLADGGEGTLLAVHAAGGWEWRECPAHDPLDRPTTARWLRSADGTRAVVEMAAASGLSLVSASERDAIRATTRGTGELLCRVLDEGIRHVVLGVGGSATTDGGLGMLVELGAAVAGDTVRLDGLDSRLGELDLCVASDVTNPLLGPQGAAAIYGPQKGASPDQVAELERRLARFADALEAASGRRARDLPGSGAAGGINFGLACLQDRFRSFAILPGVGLVMDAVGFEARLAASDLVMTGEGRIDAQTAFGKTAWGVAQRASSARLPCIAFGGSVDPSCLPVLEAAGVLAMPVLEGPSTVEEAMAAGSAPIARAANRTARLLSIGVQLTGGNPR